MTTLADIGNLILANLLVELDPEKETYQTAFVWPNAEAPWVGGNQVTAYLVGPAIDDDESNERYLRYRAEWRFRFIRCCPGATLGDMDDGEPQWPEVDTMAAFGRSVVDDVENATAALARAATAVVGACAGPFRVNVSPPSSEGICVAFELGINHVWKPPPAP